MPIYTKTGDKGATSYFDNTRVSKAHVRIEAYGTVDELNSVVGVVITALKEKGDTFAQEITLLIGIQHHLFELGAILADPHAKPKSDVLALLEKKTEKFEDEIDRITERLPALTFFILPGGGRSGALFHVARSVSRRAERAIVRLLETEPVPSEILVYINRLSDLFFAMSRWINFSEGEMETRWEKEKGSVSNH